MSRSLFRRLHRKFGVPLAPRAHNRLLQQHRSALEENLPLYLSTSFMPRANGLRVAVIGGGFAGLQTASCLQNLDFDVTLYEARSQVGGRVSSTSTFAPGRILERGAELIGRNHHAWINLALLHNLGLSVLTPDGDYTDMKLDQPFVVNGRLLTNDEAQTLHDQMDAIKRRLNSLALFINLPYGPDFTTRPWQAPGAAMWDNQSVAEWIDLNTSNSLLREALRFEFSNDMAVSADNQSLLAILTQIAAGGFDLYWEDTEVYRCENGNQSLAQALYRKLTHVEALGQRIGYPVRTVNVRLGEAVSNIVRQSNGLLSVDSHLSDQSSSATTSDVFDYVVLAVPPSVWYRITINGRAFPITPIQTGPAVKYLTHLRKRYWISPYPNRNQNHLRRQAADIPNGIAPSAVNTRFGVVWEGTDNQMGTDHVDLTVFAGGPLVPSLPPTLPRRQTPAQYYDHHFRSGIEYLIPGFTHNLHSHNSSDFVNWPEVPYIETGYCCPGPGQVTGIMQQMNTTPLLGKIFFAGEHTSPGFFGYMEGALQSGVAAAQRIAADVGISVPLAQSTTAVAP